MYFDIEKNSRERERGRKKIPSRRLKRKQKENEFF